MDENTKKYIKLLEEVEDLFEVALLENNNHCETVSNTGKPDGYNVWDGEKEDQKTPSMARFKMLQTLPKRSIYSYIFSEESIYLWLPWNILKRAHRSKWKIGRK